MHSLEEFSIFCFRMIEIYDLKIVALEFILVFKCTGMMIYFVVIVTLPMIYFVVIVTLPMICDPTYAFTGLIIYFVVIVTLPTPFLPRVR